MGLAKKLYLFAPYLQISCLFWHLRLTDCTRILAPVFPAFLPSLHHGSMAVASKKRLLAGNGYIYNPRGLRVHKHSKGWPTHSRLCCRDLVSAWENVFGTLPVQLQQWRPRDWQNYVCSQGKQNYHCIMAGVELEKKGIGHEMSNQQSEKQSLANRTQSWIASRKLVATYNFVASLFCTGQSLLRNVLDHGRW